MLRWFQDWRDRRAAIRELSDERSRSEAMLADRADNPLVLAKAAVERGDLENAAKFWDEATRRMPNVVVGSDDSLTILLEMDRFDEAETLMLERQKRSRLDRFCLPALARIAETRGDMATAAKRWEAVRAIEKHNLEGHFHGNLCLVALGRFEEAAVLMDDAIRMDPTSQDAWMERAGIAQKLGKWDECVNLWRMAVERCGFTRPLTGYVRVMTEFGRANEARAYLDDLALAHPRDLDIAAARARLARQQGDLAAAIERWAEARAIFSYFQPGFQEAVDCLREAKDEAAAEALSRQAIEQFPDKPWPLIVFARIAHDRQDWPEAVARWEEVSRRFPDEEEARTLRAVACQAAGDNASP